MCIDNVDIWFQISSIFLQLSARDMSVFSLPDDNFCKYKWIFTKRGMCIYIMTIWFVIANRQILSSYTELFARNKSVFSFLDDNLIK